MLGALLCQVRIREGQAEETVLCYGGIVGGGDRGVGHIPVILDQLLVSLLFYIVRVAAVFSSLTNCAMSCFPPHTSALVEFGFMKTTRIFCIIISDICQPFLLTESNGLISNIL